MAFMQNDSYTSIGTVKPVFDLFIQFVTMVVTLRIAGLSSMVSHRSHLSNDTILVARNIVNMKDSVHQSYNKHVLM